MKLYLTHTWELLQKRKKNGGEPFHVCFFGDQKDFYGVTLNGCRLEKGLIWSTESIARQLHHSIKEYIVRLLLCWLYRNLEVDFVYALDSVKWYFRFCSEISYASEKSRLTFSCTIMYVVVWFGARGVKLQRSCNIGESRTSMLQCLTTEILTSQVWVHQGGSTILATKDDWSCILNSQLWVVIRSCVFQDVVQQYGDRGQTGHFWMHLFFGHGQLDPWTSPA